MRRVPIPVVFLLSLAVVAGVWWRGTHDYDFLAAPTATEIEIARHRAAQQLAQPSDLFAVDPPDDLPLEPIEAPKPAPKPKPAPPTIPPGDLDAAPVIDAWTSRAGLPAVSFINLASRLEADTHLAHALIAWERVLDHSKPTAEERNTALNGVRRLRATLPPWNSDDASATPLVLKIKTPADRLQLTRRAAKAATEALEKASSGIIKIEYAISKSPGNSEQPTLFVVLDSPEASADETPPSVEVTAPESTEAIEKAILSASFKLVASRLALEDQLSPVSSPVLGESPGDSLQLRITRLAWQHFAQSQQFAESP